MTIHGYVADNFLFFSLLAQKHPWDQIEYKTIGPLTKVVKSWATHLKLTFYIGFFRSPKHDLLRRRHMVSFKAGEDDEIYSLYTTETWLPGTINPGEKGML